MAGEAEKKNISRLDFNIADAINSLEKIDEKLKNIANSSESYAKRISQNLNSSNLSSIIDVDKIQKELADVSKLSKSKQANLNAQLVKIEAKKQADMGIVVAKGEQKRQTEAYKSALKQEEYNNRVVKSTKNMYEQIQTYAKTYLIYQGFNALKKGISETIDEMVDMEYQMVAIDRVLNDNSLNINNYRDQLVQLAYDYGNTFSNVSDITLRLAQAGFNAQESLALTEKTLLALNTAELNATEATSDMVAVMAQWGLMTGNASEEARNYGEIIDRINKVADNYPTTSADIMNALKKTSSAFHLAGANIDETIATIVAAETASQRGGKVIGTALSNIIQQLKEAKKINIAESLGLDFYTDASKTEFKDIMDIFEEMSEKMQQLKNAGKENSVEMQNLLSIFTVFRRNIGSSLLGEMAGEDSTYANVLADSYSSIGYSLQENEKYMKTAKAAQAQFNAELLKLKTEVWDNGLEGVFRDMLNMGTGLVDGITTLIDKFGILPVTIGVVTLAFSLLNKNTQASNWIGLKEKIKEVNLVLKESQVDATKLNVALQGTSTGFQKYVKSIGKGEASLKGYLQYQKQATAETILLTAKTVILQSVISLGLTLAITAITTAITKWINAEEEAIKKHEELKASAEETANKLNEETKAISDLANEYSNFAKSVGTDGKKIIDDENLLKATKLQAEINAAIKDSGKQVELVTEKIDKEGNTVKQVNTAYEEQLSLIKSIAFEKKKEEVEELKRAADAAEQLKTGTKLSEGANWWDYAWGNQYRTVFNDLKKYGADLEEILSSTSDLAKEYLAENGTLISSNVDYLNRFIEVFEKLDFETQIKYLTEWREGLQEQARKGKDVSKSLQIIDDSLKRLKNQQDNATEATNKYLDALSELYAMSGQVDTFNTFLEAIKDSYNIEGPKKLISELEGINKQFSDGKINVEEYFNAIEEKIKSIDLSTQGEELEAYQAIFAATTESLAQGIETLMSGLASGSINFANYSIGIKEAADNTLDLYTKTNQLTQDSEGIWAGASEDITNYANTLQDAKDELESYGEILKTIGDNYDYIAEHADTAGQAAFKQADQSSEAYKKLADNLTQNLNALKDNNEAAFKTITQSIADEIKISTNEMYSANEYLNEGFLNNYQNMNGALNAVAKASGEATNKVAQSMGNVLTELGNAIAKFDYTINAGVSGVSWNDFSIEGTNLKFKVPNLKFSITGEGGTSVAGLSSALKQFGADVSNLGNIDFAYKTLSSKPYTGAGGTGSTGKDYTSPTTTGAGTGTSKQDTEAAKAAEEEYKARLENWESFVSNREKLEERWVKKQKELGQLSNKDFLYITEQRIKRYQSYLKQLSKMTWLNKEDRAKLEKEYKEEIEDLQLDYFDYLKDVLDDEIEALEDARDKDIKDLEEANKKKIQLIKDEAAARIDALKSVEHENDRIRTKEEYLKKRQEHLDDISYWEQRTGREAQEALLEARKNLNELDEDWKQQLEDWSIEDQIAAIEEQRDAQIKAIEDTEEAEIKTIEDTTQAQIDALQSAYDAKVKLFSESNKIIYENSTIESKNLYNLYKENFVDPLAKDLANLNKNNTTTSAKTAKKQEYSTYKVKSGDTLSAIAAKYNTTVSKIMGANPSIKNKNLIYTGDTLKIPKFHEGGMFGGVNEGLALLKRGEVILKPEWSSSLNRMMKYFDNLTAGNAGNLSGRPEIQVSGDLIKVEASIRNQTDADYLTKKLEKMLESKFNLKK